MSDSILKSLMIKMMLLSGLVLIGLCTAHAATHPVDDSGTQVLSPMVRMDWEEPVPVRGQVPSSNIVGQFAVRLRLNTKPFAGQVGKIFIRLATPASGPVRSTYQGQNVILDGAVQGGQRALVFSGVVPPVIEETVMFQVTADGNRIIRPEQLEFSFEIDVP